MARPEILDLLWQQKAHYNVYKSKSVSAIIILFYKVMCKLK